MSGQESVDVVIAGHICLDVIPAFAPGTGGLKDILIPGKLVNVGPPVVSTGGTVSNTGLALHRLGVRTRLAGKVGDDLFGQTVLGVLRGYGNALADGMMVQPGAVTSYSVVLSPPGVDRIFLHCPGANDTFHPNELSPDALGSARILHFGYPPLMRLTYADEGEALATLFERLRAQGVFVSLDMARPDPDSEAGKVDWRAWLERVLPHVDLFGPSLDEIRFMLGLEADTNFEAAELSRIGNLLLEMGARMVALKLGADGLYLRTSDQIRLPDGSEKPIEPWMQRELLTPCFQVEVKGTTGAGDCTLAGLLAGLVHGQHPEAAMLSAVGVGAYSVEAPDATSGIPTWTDVQQRIRQAWSRLPIQVDLSGWREEADVYSGPNDGRMVRP